MKFPKTLSSDFLLQGLLESYPHCDLEGIGIPEHYTDKDLVLAFRQSQLNFLKNQPAILIIDEHIDTKDLAMDIIKAPHVRLLLKNMLNRVETLYFSSNRELKQKHPTAIVHPSVIIEDNVELGPYVIVEEGCVLSSGVQLATGVHIQKDSFIGPNVEIGSHTVVYPRTIIGESTKIYASSVLGMPGFGFELVKGCWECLPHLSGLHIGSHCFIGSHVSIAAGTLHPTIISDHVIIDNQVQIAHHVEIGKGTAIAGCVGIAGSTKIGQYCLIGGGVGITGHIVITDRVTITGMSMITKSILKSGTYSSGMPAEENHLWRKKIAYMARIPNLVKDFYQSYKKKNEQ
jgi:UDP-3-O-[3-hydroxymyristoyl] glucosamine N-acyltransferase